MKIKFITTLFAVLLFTADAFAQDTEPDTIVVSPDTIIINPDTIIVNQGATVVDTDTAWTIGGLNTTTFSQVSLTNWAAGGQNSVAINAATSIFADYARGRHTWENSLDMGYGLVKQNDLDFNKSDDRLNFVTKYGYQIDRGSANWFLSALLDFRSQFTKGRSAEDPDSVISRFMAPGYLVVGLGVDYKPSKALSFNYIPLTGKFTFVTDPDLAELGAYGVEPGNRARAELGSYFRAKYKNEIFKNVNLDTRLELFANYLKDFGNIDVNWQNAIVMKINRVLSANFTTHLIYDDDIKIEIDNNDDGVVDEVGPRIQFKSVFGVGLGYNFGASRDK